MQDPGWDLWDAGRVRTALWPSTRHWEDAADLWPRVAVSPAEERPATEHPVRASDIDAAAGDLWVTYWAWAIGTPFVKIGRTQHEPDRDGKWRGKHDLAERRVRGWSTGCPWHIQLIRVHLGENTHEDTEHKLRAGCRMNQDREWFDLRRLESGV